MIGCLKTHSALSLEPSLLVITRPIFRPNILLKIFSLETSLTWTVIARSSLIGHDFYGVKDEYKHQVQT